MSTSVDLLAVEGLASRFLQESVFASREASHGFSPRSLEGATGCGLGLRPVIPDDFSERQARLLSQMIEAAALDAAAVPFDALRDRAAAWVRTQDGIDRQRNHFLRDFREQHGFARETWSVELQAAFQTGLDAVNADNRARLETAARDLAALLRGASDSSAR